MCFSSTLLTFKYQCRRFKNKTNVSFASTPPLPAIPEGHFRLQHKPSIPSCTSIASMSFSAGYSSPRPHVTFKRCPSRIYHFIISLCVGLLYMYAWTQPTCLVPGAGGVREHWIPWDRRYRWCVCGGGGEGNGCKPFIIHLQAGLALGELATQRFPSLHLPLELPLQPQVLFPHVPLLLQVLGHLLGI